MNPFAYEAIEPCPELRPFVRRLIVANENGLENVVMRPTPTGYNYLGWIYSGEFSISVDHKVPRKFRGLTLCGQVRSEELEIRIAGRAPHILAEFTATGLYRLTHASGETIRGRAVEMERLSPKVHARLTDCLNSPVVDMEGPVCAFEQALLACVEDSLPEIDYLEHVANGIELSDGRVKISELSKEAGISQRQLARKYNDIVGIGPKFFSRVLQANTAFSALATGDVESLGELAQSCGYHDQAHFVRTMQEIFRHSPGELLRNSPAELVEFLQDSRRFSRQIQ